MWLNKSQGSRYWLGCLCRTADLHFVALSGAGKCTHLMVLRAALAWGLWYKSFQAKEGIGGLSIMEQLICGFGYPPGCPVCFLACIGMEIWVRCSPLAGLGLGFLCSSPCRCPCGWAPVNSFHRGLLCLQVRAAALQEPVGCGKSDSK